MTTAHAPRKHSVGARESRRQAPSRYQQYKLAVGDDEWALPDTVELRTDGGGQASAVSPNGVQVQQ